MGDAAAAAELAPPPLSRCLLPLWEAFRDLSRTRLPGFASSGPITWTEIASWQSAHRCQLDPFETEQIMKLDALWREKD